MKKAAIISALLCAAMLCVPAHAALVSMLPTQNTVIRTDNPPTNYNGFTSMCNFAAPGGATIGGMIMSKFDLSSYAGQIVAGAVLSNGISWGLTTEYGMYASRQILSNWTASVVTWENFVGPVNDTTWMNTVGPEMDVQQAKDFAGSGWLVGIDGFVVSNDVVQSWINNPAQNYGVAIIPQYPQPAGTSLNQCWVGMAMNWQPNYVPRLYVDLVPEPAVFALFAGVLMLFRRR